MHGFLRMDPTDFGDPLVAATGQRIHLLWEISQHLLDRLVENLAQTS